MNEPPCVVDASVALKWALDDEEHIAEAVALRDAWVHRGEHRPVAPSLFYYEVVNGLCTAARRGRIAPEVGAELLRHLLAVGVRLIDPDAEHIYQLANRYSIAAYDSAYLALAEALDCPLWTGNRFFHAAVSDRATRVRWIGDYAPTR